MNNLHKIQMQIIRELTFSPLVKFSKLNKNHIDSDKFSYHLRTLFDDGFIDKTNNDEYSLTNKGKIYSSHMDTDTERIELLPKTSVLVIPINNLGKDLKYLIHTRTKEPYFGYSGCIAGKIRFGETVEETAKRELNEEAGILGEDFSYGYTLHEMVYNKEGQQLEDKFFNVVSFHGFTGIIKSQTQDGKNKWVTEKEFKATNPLFHNEIDIFNWFLDGKKGFLEEKYYIEKY